MLYTKSLNLKTSFCVHIPGESGQYEVASIKQFHSIKFAVDYYCELFYVHKGDACTFFVDIQRFVNVFM